MVGRLDDPSQPRPRRTFFVVGEVGQLFFFLARTGTGRLVHLSDERFCGLPAKKGGSRGFRRGCCQRCCWRSLGDAGQNQKRRSSLLCDQSSIGNLRVYECAALLPLEVCHQDGGKISRGTGHLHAHCTLQAAGCCKAEAVVPPRVLDRIGMANLDLARRWNRRCVVVVVEVVVEGGGAMVDRTGDDQSWWGGSTE